MVLLYIGVWISVLRLLLCDIQYEVHVTQHWFQVSPRLHPTGRSPSRWTWSHTPVLESTKSASKVTHTHTAI